jgi:hypothetical protein
MYCGIHVYEKLDGMSAWLLGFIALRELLTDKTVEVDGKAVPLNAANPRARINEYIKGQTSSKSRRTKLQQTLANLFNRVSTGVHNDVTPEEAQSLFLQTYLFLGEVLTLGEPPDRTIVQPESPSSDMVGASSPSSLDP